MSTAGFSAFLARKNIKPSAKLYFVDAMSAMAMGLFASLLIGTILDTLGDQFHWDWLVTAAGYASSATGIAIAVAIGVSLSAPPLAACILSAPWDSAPTQSAARWGHFLPSSLPPSWAKRSAAKLKLIFSSPLPSPFFRGWGSVLLSVPASAS